MEILQFGQETLSTIDQECEQTWIEGTLFYEIKTYKKRDLAKKRERDALIAKAKDTLNSGKQKDVSQQCEI